MNPARLLFPALRWQARGGFAAEADTIRIGLERGVGGFILFGGTVESTTELTTALRLQAGRPLLIGADLERGAGQQVAGLTELPPPAALASLGDQAAIRTAGAITGAEARLVGIDWVYAPDADLDLEPANPIVQTRSFGADPDQVAACVGSWIDGCQEAGALACAKHFPGHGRTKIDPHDTLPAVTATEAELQATDLVPFRAAIEHRVASIMTAHVNFPALDPARPATLSGRILDSLRNQLRFDGAIVSDALMMGALRGRQEGPPGLVALRAGVDLLLYPEAPWDTLAAIDAARPHDQALEARLDAGLARYLGLVARAAVPSVAVDLSRNRDTAAELADRLVRRSAPDLVLRPPLELVLADDDQDGAYPASPNDYLRRMLEAAAVPLGTGGSVVLLAFAEPRASKGRAGFGPRTRAVFDRVGPGADLIVLFAHPRLEAELPNGVPVIRAWHRQRLMQEAVARWIGARLR